MLVRRSVGNGAQWLGVDTGFVWSRSQTRHSDQTVWITPCCVHSGGDAVPCIAKSNVTTTHKNIMYIGCVLHCVNHILWPNACGMYIEKDIMLTHYYRKQC